MATAAARQRIGECASNPLQCSQAALVRTQRLMGRVRSSTQNLVSSGKLPAREPTRFCVRCHCATTGQQLFSRSFASSRTLASDNERESARSSNKRTNSVGVALGLLEDGGGSRGRGSKFSFSRSPARPLPCRGLTLSSLGSGPLGAPPAATSENQSLRTISRGLRACVCVFACCVVDQVGRRRAHTEDRRRSTTADDREILIPPKRSLVARPVCSPACAL